MAEFLVDLKPASEWTRKISKDQLVARDGRRARRDSRASSQLLAADPRQHPREHLADRRPDRDQGVRRRPAPRCERMRPRSWKRSRDVPGVARAFIDRAGQVPQLQIEIDRARAARYGLNVADIQDVIETALGGTRSDRDLGRRAAIRRRGAPAGEARADADTVRQILRRHARTAPTCRWRTSPTSASRQGAMNISRESGTPLIAIGVFIRGRDMGSAVEEMQHAGREERASCPPGYTTALGRRVREPAARDGAAAGDRAAQRLPDLPAAVQRVPSVAQRHADPAQHSVRAGRRHPRAAGHRHPLSVSAAIGFIALFGAGGAERRGDGELLQPAARERHAAARRGAARARTRGCAPC